MSLTPLEWHLHPGAQALIGLIAGAGHQPQTRNVRDPLSSSRAPQHYEQRYYDCPEFGELELLLIAARGEAMDAGNKAYKAGTPHDEAFADFIALADTDLATLIETEIARRGQAVPA